MVKGITRQIILVKSPDPKLFEEAIFIVKEEALAREGVSADRVLKEARQAADGYLRQGRAWNRRLERLPGPVWGVGGAVLASLGSLVGLLLAFYLTYMGAYASLSAANLLVFLIMWLVPTPLISGMVNKY